MKRSSALLVLALFLVGTGAVASSSDVSYFVTIDGRPMTPPAKPTGALLRDGVVYVDVVVATKAFSGLLTFGNHGKSAKVSVQRRTAEFVVGRNTADYGGTMSVMSGKPFVSDGDLFVPLSAFARLAKSTVAVNATAHTAALTTSQP